MEFEKYHKIRVLGDDENRGILDAPDDLILIEEKIDGANFRVYIKPDGNMFIGSRNRTLDEKDVADKAWIRCVRFITEKLRDYVPDKDTILFGECCTKHTMNYDFGKMPPYLAFDLKVDGKYVDYKEKILMFEDNDLPYVPIVGYMTAGELKKKKIEDMVPVSEYALESAEDKLAEGIVIKNYKRQLFAKYVRDIFREKNREVFGGSPKYGETEEDRWVLMYVTNPRIEKAILKIIDDGNKLEMALMKKLPNFVWEDVWEEECMNIVRTYKKLEFRDCRKRLTKRCLNVLQQMIINKEMSEKE